MIAKLSDAVFPHAESTLAGVVDAANDPVAPREADSAFANNYPKPVEILQDLQSELYAQSDKPSSEQADLVSVGLLSLDIAAQLLRT